MATRVPRVGGAEASTGSRRRTNVADHEVDPGELPSEALASGDHSWNGEAMPARGTTLDFGEFFGSRAVDRNLAGFRLACHTAATPADDLPEHTHVTAHLVYVMSGDYVSAAAALEPGRSAALVYNPPATRHRDTFVSPRGTFFTLSISDARLESLGLHAALPDAVRWSSGRVLRRARRVVDLLATWPPRSTARAEATCIELLDGLLDVRARPRPPVWLERFRERLAGSLDRRLAVGALAAAEGIHPVHAIRAFQRFYGCTPAAFARRRRLDAAAEALRTGDASLVEVALAAGFADQSHFTRAFTAAYGLSPARYRRETALVIPG